MYSAEPNPSDRFLGVCIISVAYIMFTHYEDIFKSKLKLKRDYVFSSLPDHSKVVIAKSLGSKNWYYCRYSVKNECWYVPKISGEPLRVWEWKEIDQNDVDFDELKNLVRCPKY
jgi:hypothetical protein